MMNGRHAARNQEEKKEKRQLAGGNHNFKMTKTVEETLTDDALTKMADRQHEIRKAITRI